MHKKNKAQVWVETAIYSLVGLTIIAILLAAAMPQVNKMKDKAIVTQTINSLNKLDCRIIEIQQSPANIRISPFRLTKGNLEINPDANQIIYTLENTNLELSEANEPDIPEADKIIVTEGNILLKTEKYGRKFKIFLTINYTEILNLTYDGKEKSKTLQSGTTDYQIKVENPGDNIVGEPIHIDLSIL